MDRSGVAHFVAENDVDAIKIAKRLLSFLPANNLLDPPRAEHDKRHFRDEALNNVVADEPKLPCDILEIIGRIVDRSDFLEVQKEYAKNLVIGFGRLVGRPVGIIANQPSVLAGVLDINASDQGRALHPLLQCLQHPADHSGGRARRPPRNRSGT